MRSPGFMKLPNFSLATEECYDGTSASWRKASSKDFGPKMHGVGALERFQPPA